MTLDPDELDEIDIDVEVCSQPHDDKIREIIVETLRSVGKPLKFAELRRALNDRGYFVGEDKLRSMLREMIADGTLIEFPDGTIGLPEWIKWYVPRSDVKRVKPMNRYRFYELYGEFAAKIRKMGLPVAEALSSIRYLSEKRDNVKNVLRVLNSVTQGEEDSHSTASSIL